MRAQTKTARGKKRETNVEEWRNEERDGRRKSGDGKNEME